MNEIRYHVTIMVSSLIHVVLSLNRSFMFVVKSYSIVLICHVLLMYSSVEDIGIVPLFWLLP